MATPRSIFELKKQWEENNELQAIIVDLSNENILNPVPRVDLDDDRKRWLIVGISLHHVMSPILRNFVRAEVQKQYAVFKGSHNIDTQTFPNQLMKFPLSKHQLNYEAINNNNTRKLPRNKPDLANYDYGVQNEVDFSKLFLQTHMTHYTGIDDSCDQSALLGIIANMGTFTPLVSTAAGKLRKDIRNPWAHCNYAEWDTIKYQISFQTMYQLIKNLALPQQDEQDAIAELTKWETHGLHFLRGTTLGLEVLQDIKRETKALAKFCIESEIINVENLEKMKNALSNVDLELEKCVKSIADVEHRQRDLETKTDHLDRSVQLLYTRTNNVEHAQDFAESQLSDIQDVLSNQNTVLTGVTKDVERLTVETDSIKQTTDTNKDDLENVQQRVTENAANIEKLSKYLHHARPPDKPFFYPPNRISNFVGREDELDQLEAEFQRKGNETHTQVVCGLGGTGKTTLSVEYSWRFCNYYPGGVFWMTSDNDESLDNCIQRLAMDTDTTGTNTKETMFATLRWLSLQQERWLLVIDNVDVDDLDGNIRELLLGSWKHESKGHIIVTSRREAIDAEETFKVCADACVTLDVLTSHESKQFLKARTGRSAAEDDEPLKTLVVELGGLPLALEQAAAHIVSLKCTFKQYLDKFLKKRLRLLRVSKARDNITSKERLAVQTTWQINFDYILQHSEESGLGNGAVYFMEISAFLFPDDIPLELLNVGSPEEICIEDLKEAVEDELGQRQIMEVLTRFSLFQRISETGMSVHRLVQEVIRETISDEQKKLTVLQSASRMVHYALTHSTTPNDVVTKQSLTRGALKLWSKLALHANTIKSYTMSLSEKSLEIKQTVFFTKETLLLLQTSSIYHSLFQRQNEAMACQAQMIQIITAIDMTDEESRDLTSLTVPLRPNDKLLIENGLATVLESEHTEADQQVLPLDVETLRQKGNTAFKAKQYQVAIQYYTEAIKNSGDSTDAMLYSNRALANLRNMAFTNALNDANTCIDLDPMNFKGYCWKAYAITNLIRLKELPESWEAVGLAAAAVAGHLNNQCLLEYKMKIEYPVVRFKVINNPLEVGQEMSSLMNMSHTTLLLKNGVYAIAPYDITTKSVQIIGIEDKVSIYTKNNVFFIRPSESWFSVPFHVPSTIHVYFENVKFAENSGQVCVGQHVTGTFTRCTFSNGLRSCKKFPLCDGQEGCVNPNKKECKKRFELTKVHKSVAGIAGNAGITAESGGRVFLDSCMIDGCGGGGVLSTDNGSFMSLKRCTVQNMRQMGVEARNGGSVLVQNCTIRHNQFHGVAIGPRGIGEIRDCIIHDNLEEGIWTGGILDNDIYENKMLTTPEDASVCKIVGNVINRNGMCGISMDGGTFTVTSNRIFDNWLWGVMAKSRSSADISFNDIFENKCGGVRIGINYSAIVLIDGNTIKDHCGPAIYSVTDDRNLIDERLAKLGGKNTEMAMKMQGKPTDEINVFTKEPIITSRNVLRDNKSEIRHPKTMLNLVKTCGFCKHFKSDLKICGRCGKAAYCSKNCQKNHWKRHRHMCDLLNQKYVVQIDMAQTRPFPKTPGMPKEIMMKMRFTSGKLQGIGEGVPPSRKSARKFVVKIQSGFEYTRYDPQKEMSLYDKSLGLDIYFQNEQLYHLVNECGELASNTFTTKKMFCWASFKHGGCILCIHTDSLPEFQTW